MGAIDATIGRIKQMLVDGELRPGDKLPVEKDLAAGLGVSRNTLREAVRALTTLKVLQTRQGDGTYVTSLQADLLLDGLGFIVDLHGEAGELQFLHVRRLLEPEATALAVGRFTDAGLAELRGLLAEAHSLIEAPALDHPRLMANDRAFHNVITARCGNPVLAALIENASGHTVRARMWRGRLDAGAGSRTVAEHQMIYQAIADRDSERARMLAAAHILGVEAAVRAMTGPDPAQRGSLGQAGR